MRKIGLHGILLLGVFASTCTPNALQIQARLANTVALAGNRALPLLTDTYRADGDRIIYGARAEGLPREEAERRLRAHVVAWQPVWGDCDDDTGVCSGGAWPALRATHEAWATLLERWVAGEVRLDLDTMTRHAREIHAAYCALRAALPPTTRASVPNVPGMPCL